MGPLTPLMRGTLKRAARDPEGLVYRNIGKGMNGPAKQKVIDGLRMRGLVSDDAAPVITQKGRDLVASWEP